MELRLARKPNRRPRIKGIDLCSIYPFDIEPRTETGLELFAQIIDRLIGGLEQVSIHALEFAVDPFIPHHILDEMNRRGVTLRRVTRTLLAMQLLDLVIAIIERVDYVCRCSCVHAATDRAIINHDPL